MSAPVRVIEVPTLTRLSTETAEAATAAPAHAPELPSYSWFSIVGTAGDLRAGIADGAGNGSARGGTSVWFVREGDRLPGGVTVTRIVARPPGVHVDGAVEAALPYSPRPSGVTGPAPGMPRETDREALCRRVARRPQGARAGAGG